jgi:hypothetical protein
MSNIFKITMLSTIVVSVLALVFTKINNVGLIPTVKAGAVETCITKLPIPDPRTTFWVDQNPVEQDCISNNVNIPGVDTATFNFQYQKGDSGLEKGFVSLELFGTSNAKSFADYFDIISLTEDYRVGEAIPDPLYPSDSTKWTPPPVLSKPVSLTNVVTNTNGLELRYVPTTQETSRDKMCSVPLDLNSRECGNDPNNDSFVDPSKINDIYYYSSPMFGLGKVTVKLKATAPEGAYDFNIPNAFTFYRTGQSPNDVPGKVLGAAHGRNWRITGVVPPTSCAAGQILINSVCIPFPFTINPNSSTTDTTPDIVGTCYNGANVTITISGQTLTTVCVGSVFTVTPITPLIPGFTYPISAIQTLGTTTVNKESSVTNTACTNGANNGPNCDICPVGQFLAGTPAKCIGYNFTITVNPNTLQTSPEIKGSCYQNSDITITIDNQILTTKCSNGVFSVSPKNLLPGQTYQISGTQTFGGSTANANGSIKIDYSPCTNEAINTPTCNQCPLDMIMTSGKCQVAKSTIPRTGGHTALSITMISLIITSLITLLRLSKNYQN